MGASRKKAIYDLCVEYGKHDTRLDYFFVRLTSYLLIDVIIVEDDPYYFLQQGQYKARSERSVETIKHDGDIFLHNLAPSYLKFDYQGRVIRLDTFSKV